MSILLLKDGAEQVRSGESAGPHLSERLTETSAPHDPAFTEPGMSVLQDAPCEEKVPVGMMLRENRSYPFVAGSETPTGNSFLESVRNATITCQECGVRAQMRCSCGVLVCLRHVYDIDGDLYCSSCVVYIRAERNIQDDLTLEMYKNIARRR